MSLEKPWAKPFDQLLVEVVARWGGEIKTVKSDYSKLPDRAMPTDYYYYPSYYGKIEGIPAMIEISDFPAGLSDNPYENIAEGSDNMQYLQIRLHHPGNYVVAVLHEDIGEKLRKLFHRSHDFQTHNLEFDKKYLLHLKSPSDQKLLLDTSFQRAVEALEPFTHLAVSKQEILLSECLSKKTQLIFAAVEKKIEVLLQIVKMVS